MNVYNPFYESMKMKEEMYNIRFKKKKIKKYYYILINFIYYII